MKREIHKIKNDVADLRSDMTGMRSDLTDGRSVLKQVVSTLVRLDDKVERMFESMVTRKDHAELISRMDGFTAQLEAGRFDWAKHQVRLDAHEKRLNRLEGRRS